VSTYSVSEQFVTGLHTTLETPQRLAQYRSIGLQKSLKLIVTALVIVALTAMLNVESVSAQTLVLSPNPVTQGVNVQITGNGFQPSETGQIQVYTSSGGGCSAIPIMNLAATSDTNGNLEPLNITTSGLAGTYCVEANGFLTSPEPVSLVVNASATATSTASSQTPGYLYFIPLGVASIGLAFLVINRRNRKEDTF